MDTFTFGKYKGRSVDAICYENPKYCIWAHENVKFFSLTPEQLTKANNRIDDIEDSKAEWAEEVYGLGGNGLWDIGLEP